MMNWYENPEIHEEDYEELMKLLAEEDKEEKTMAGAVEFGRVWTIETAEDFWNAWEILEENAFCAKMSDDYRLAYSEECEIAKQKMEIVKKAREKGIID